MQPANSLTIPEVEKAIQADLSIDAAHEHMTFLVEQVGERLAGTERIQKAANYIRQELERCGLEARIDRFPIYQSYPKSAALRVTYPEERVIEALPSCHILSTTDEGITGEMVYAGAGGYEDYENISPSSTSPEPRASISRRCAPKVPSPSGCAQKRRESGCRPTSRWAFSTPQGVSASLCWSADTWRDGARPPSATRPATR